VHVNSSVPPWEIFRVMSVTVSWGFTPVQFEFGHPACAPDTVDGAVNVAGWVTKVEGLAQREIARRLYISDKTVSKHIEHILAKLGVHTRAQAVARAARDPLLGASA
jgi:hypothetical protein